MEELEKNLDIIDTFLMAKNVAEIGQDEFEDIKEAIRNFKNIYSNTARELIARSEKNWTK